MSALGSAPGAKLAAVCDPNREAAEALAAGTPGCRAYGDAAELLEAEDLGAVHILAPPPDHAPLAVQAAEAGCHVLVEKPFALSVGEADAMIGAARERGITLAANHNYLLKPSVLKARRLVDEGAIGDVVFVDSWYGLTDEAASFAGPEHWAARLPGGVFTNFLPHLVSLEVAFLGEISVAGVTLGGDGSELAVLVESERGPGVMAVSTRVRPYAKSVRIFGTSGIVQADLVREVTTIHKQRKLPRLLSKAAFNLEEIPQLAAGTVANTAKVLTRAMPNMPDLHNMVREFHAAAAAGRPPPATGEDGRANVAVLEQVWSRMPGPAPAAP